MGLVIATIVILAYFLGSIPFGFIIAKSQGIDIREHGSKNIGATNVWRVLGKKFGLTTFILDVLKGVAAVLVAKWIAGHWAVHVPLPHGHERIDFLRPDYAGIAGAMGCILGHSAPVWLGFKGGKGVATSLGVLFGMIPLVAFADFALWGLVFWLSRYVSLASIAAAVGLPVLTIVFLFLGWIEGWGYFQFAWVAGLLVIWRHWSNIKRLAAGTESRFGKKPEPAEPPTTEPPTAA